MAVSRDSIVILHIVRERDCYKPIDNLVERTIIHSLFFVLDIQTC